MAFLAGNLAYANEGNAIAVGYGANGGYQASSVGYLANAYNRGAIVGYSGTCANRGAGVGYSVSCENSGAGLGYDVSGYDGGVAVGYIAKGGESNIAIGCNAWANEYGGGAEVCRIAIGNAVSNSIDNSCAIRGSLYLDGATSIQHRPSFNSGVFVRDPLFLGCYTNVDTTTVICYGQLDYYFDTGSNYFIHTIDGTTNSYAQRP